ncbi:MAG: tRNA (adenine(22)-N(1))-methyltransferase TrmK [Bacillota bacterium]|nr:tRNA (adenine(22)-N(1))-methyltransferase TrmK [Bacillota bacterium]
MNTDKLSDRLNTVAKFVPKGARLADIGSDHAYLPCYLAKKEVVSFAIAGEVVTGPFESAKKQVVLERLTEVIQVRLGDGLDVIKPKEVDCITIAGMGGTLITSILDRGRSKLESVQRLILQPNISAISIRKWLFENNWELVNESILEEDGKIYEILVAEKGNARKPYKENIDAGLLLGPFLLERKEAPFIKKWSMEIENWRKIFSELENASENDEVLHKKQDLLRKIELVKGAIKE